MTVEIADQLQASRRRLIYRIQRRYRTSIERLRFGEIEIDFTRIADPDVVLDEVAAEEDRWEKLTGIRVDEPRHLPYWAQLWDSAGALATALSQEDLQGKLVLDLGCGMGLSGCAAAARGAEVMFADLESPALLFARLNVMGITSRARFRQLNWQKDSLGEKFDLILGADIIYERKQWDFLESFWKRHLSVGGRILLAEPNRQSGEMFIPWISEKAWKLEIREEINPVVEKRVRLIGLTI